MKKWLWNVTAMFIIATLTWAFVGCIVCFGPKFIELGGVVYGYGFAAIGFVFGAAILSLFTIAGIKRLFGKCQNRTLKYKRGNIKFLWRKTDRRDADSYGERWRGAWHCESTARLPKDFVDKSVIELHGIVRARGQTDYGFNIEFAEAFTPKVMFERVMSHIVRNGETG